VKIRGLHHITLICKDMERTIAFYRDLLGLRLIKRTVNFDDPDTKHFYFGDDSGTPGTVVTFFEYPDAPPGRVGAGSTHHFAFEVETDEQQLEWQNKLRAAGVSVTPVRNRKYFKSIYFHDLDGHLLEIATRGPGFTVDEDLESLGEKMVLPDEEVLRR
jgi:glyoxalase family protein